MYDMYPWDAAADSPRGRTPTPPKPHNGHKVTAPATAAVQVALDRRDSGGEAADDEYDGPVLAVPGRK